MIHAVLFYLALGTLLLLAATAVEFMRGNRRMRRLQDISPDCDVSPKVSIIITARNEAQKIEAALQSVLKQDYPNLGIILVNDRSDDDTGKILSRVAQVSPRLRVLTVSDLPVGWLGKNHAAHVGAEQATGEWLLFTDADVMMEPTVVCRAMHYRQEESLDHVAVAPHLTMPGTLLSMFGGAFAIFFGLYAKPWLARDPKSKRHIGIGAFNLIRTAIYRQVGGHATIAMRPDDDMRLGKIIKRAGGRQEMLLGEGMLTVEWYSSVGELVRGLEKNTFAGVDYKIGMVVAASVLQAVTLLWPVLALVVTRGATWWLNAGSVAVIAVLYADNAGFHGLKRWHWVGFPVTAVMFQYIVWRATLKTLRNDGINWRGTHYSLAELKTNKV